MKSYNIKVGYVGVGNMGGGIAQGLIEKGFNLTIYDLRPEAMAPLAKLGAKAADSLKDLVENVDHIYLCVEDDKGVIGVIKGKNGILDYARPGQVIVVQSTCKLTTAQDVAKAAEAKGVGLLDAPVSGDFKDRLEGTLAIYVGGEEKFFEECRPVLNAMGAEGKKVVHLGPSGCGELGKLINNQIAVPMHSVVQQTMTLARAYGLTEQRVLEIAAIGTGQCWSTQTWPYVDDILTVHRLGPGLNRIGRKDLIDAQIAALNKGVNLPIVDIFLTSFESIQCERAEYLAKRDGGFDYPVDQTVSLLVNGK